MSRRIILAKSVYDDNKQFIIVFYSKNYPAKAVTFSFLSIRKIKPFHTDFLLSFRLTFGLVGGAIELRRKSIWWPPYRASIWTRRMTVSSRCGASRINLRNSDRRNSIPSALKYLCYYSCAYCSVDVAFYFEMTWTCIVRVVRKKETFEHWTVTGFDSFSCASDLSFSMRCTE